MYEDSKNELFIDPNFNTGSEHTAADYINELYAKDIKQQTCDEIEIDEIYVASMDTVLEDKCTNTDALTNVFAKGEDNMLVFGECLAECLAFPQ